MLLRLLLHRAGLHQCDLPTLWEDAGLVGTAPPDAMKAAAGSSGGPRAGTPCAWTCTERRCRSRHGTAAHSGGRLGGFVHLVAPGESLSSVATTDGLAVAQLAAPTACLASTEPGDTLGAIAARAVPPSRSWAAANSLAPAGLLLAGTTLTLGGGNTGSAEHELGSRLATRRRSRRRLSPTERAPGSTGRCRDPVPVTSCVFAWLCSGCVPFVRSSLASCRAFCGTRPVPL